MAKRVVLAVGDAGAAGYFIPIYSTLAERYELEILADPEGKAKDGLAKAGIEFAESHGVGYDLAGVDAVVCGTAAKAPRLWENISTAALEKGIPLIWCGDFYSSGCEKRMCGLDPTAMLVFDDVTTKTFGELHSSFSPGAPKEDQLFVVGSPANDALSNFDLESERMKSREELGYQPNERRLALYSASSMAQFDLEGESLRPLVAWMERQPLDLAIGFHPADKPEEIERLTEWLKSALVERFVPIDGKLGGLSLLAAADMVLTDYSTTGVQACLAGIPTGFMLGTSAIKYQRGRGGVFPFFSVLEGGLDVAPAVLIKDADVSALDNLLERTSHEVRRLLKNPRFSVLSDGRAGERVLEHLGEIIG